MTSPEYFTVNYPLTINIELLDTTFSLPSYDIFEAEIPLPFIVSSEFSHIDALALVNHSDLNKNEFKYIVQLLQAQNNKLNLLLSFMLSQQDDEKLRHKTIDFGASSFSYLSKQPLDINTNARIKLFIEDPASAIYCYASVTNCVQIDDAYQVSMTYSLLRDHDQDILIKTALNQQKKLLRRRSLNRVND